MKAGSEMNLLAIGKSLRGHIAATASSAASEVGVPGAGGRRVGHGGGPWGGQGLRALLGGGFWGADSPFLALPARFSQQGSFLSPLLRRTASARSALKRSPSAGVVEKGKVLQQRKVRQSSGDEGTTTVLGPFLGGPAPLGDPLVFRDLAGVGDEGCEVSGTGAAPATPGTWQPNLVLHVDRAGPASSIDAAPTPA